MNSILRCLSIHKSFTLGRKSDSDLRVLKGIDFEVSEGEIVSIVGASGSGKSTLLHILGGLDRPTEGTVFWKDSEIFKLGDEALAKLRGEHAGFVFQFHHLLPEFTALENVMIPIMIRNAHLHAGERTQTEEGAKALLAKVGLSERLNHKPGELSGGEQQRVAVARALANHPRIIFADEPSGNLDSVSSQHLHDLILDLNKTQNQTFVIVTHNEKLAEQSQRVFRMDDGKLLQL